MAEAPARSVTDFLNELDERESLVALQMAYSQKSALYFKTEAAEKIVMCTIDALVDKRVMLKLESPEMPVSVDVEISIKFNIGTEVYFIKTPIKKLLGKPYFETNVKVIQLKRRKEPRYLIPKKWLQTAAVLGAHAKIKPVPCSVINISRSGMRLEVKDLTQLPFQRDDLIKIQFQIHRRAEVNCEALVRFFMNRLNQGTFLGLELVFATDMQKERVAGIVEDLIGFQKGQKF